MRMWYNGRTSAFQADDVSSILIIRSIFKKHLQADGYTPKQMDIHSVGP